MRHHAVVPLGPDKAAQLSGSPGGVDVSQPNGNEARVPQPLVGVDAGGGTGPATEVVAG
jgi:hypothetical protein